ncbi:MULTISPECIES: HD-GYP domain-containing protein [Methylobacterium]|nr:MULTISPECIES: HD domain-containing phosphohydrolase [Methylobacterium]
MKGTHANRSLMASGNVVVLSDRPDRGRHLAEAVAPVADCRLAGVEEHWADLDATIGIIADVTPTRSETRVCLNRLLGRLQGRRLPAIHLVRSSQAAAVHEAQSLGATACLPATLDPSVVVEALFRQIHPEDTIAELIVRRHVARTGELINSMFHTAETGGIDMEEVERGLDPVMDAVKDGGLTGWLEVVRMHDDITFQHCLLVAGLTAGFARSLRLSGGDSQRMVRAALVHDVGKSRIPAAILNKPGRLDPDERTVMRTHAAIGHEILLASGSCDAITLAVTRHHHEMLDGSGYPDGLSGSAIGDPVRLLTICDIYAALIERRPYKAPMPESEALRVLQSMEGKLEAGLVDAFAKSIVVGLGRPAAAG